MDKKYELTNETIEFKGKTLYRVKALKKFNDVNVGDLGGFVESENNLSQEDNCWIYDDGKVLEHANVNLSAKVKGRATVCGNAQVYNDVVVENNAVVRDFSILYGSVNVGGNSIIQHNAQVGDWAKVRGNAIVSGNAEVGNKALIEGHAEITGYATVFGETQVRGLVRLSEYAELSGKSIINSNSDYMEFKRNWKNNKIVDSIIWTKSDNMWTVGSFHGTSEELLKYAETTDGYDSESLNFYKTYIELVEKLHG